MQRRYKPISPPRRWLLATALAAMALPAAAPAETYPLLEQLNRETQSLYQDVQAGIVRVQLPVPRWAAEAAAKDDPLKRWDQVVDPNVQKKLRDRQAAGSGRMEVRITPTTQPAGGPAGAAPIEGVGSSWKVSPGEGGEIVLESRGPQGAAIVLHSADPAPVIAGGLRPPQPPADFVPNNIGLLLDDQGHVLVPLYIEREAVGDAPLRIMIQDVQATARFVGSDEKMQVTILRLEKAVGRPVRMSQVRPLEGAMVMLLNPSSGTGRLTLWTGGQRDYGVVVNMDGTVAGIVRYGQFLGGPACRPVIEQLIRAGKIQRAVIGVRLTEVPRGEENAQRPAALGDAPALRVDDVAPQSLAQAAGLRAGDYILEFDGHPVGDLTTWAALTTRTGPSKVVVLREGKRVEITLDLRQPE